MTRHRCTLVVRRAVLVLAAITGLAGCGDDGATRTATSDEVATSSPTPADPVVSPTSGAATPSATSGAICDLLEPAEISAVLGPGASVPPGGSIGDLSPTGFGGQCLWTLPEVGNLELNVWVPGSVNPPPGEAPAAGSSDVVTIDNGAYGAADGLVFLVKVTGAAFDDAQAVAAARALVPTVRERIS